MGSKTFTLGYFGIGGKTNAMTLTIVCCVQTRVARCIQNISDNYECCRRTKAPQQSDLFVSLTNLSSEMPTLHTHSRETNSRNNNTSLRCWSASSLHGSHYVISYKHDPLDNLNIHAVTEWSGQVLELMGQVHWSERSRDHSRRKQVEEIASSIESSCRLGFLHHQAFRHNLHSKLQYAQIMISSVSFQTQLPHHWACNLHAATKIQNII